MSAFSAALAQDEKSPQLLMTLIEAAMKSPLNSKFLKFCSWLEVEEYVHCCVSTRILFICNCLKTLCLMKIIIMYR